MKLICPNCYKTFDTPDYLAGKPVNCTYCGHTFTAPENYIPPTSSAPSPAPLVVPAPVPVPETPQNLPTPAPVPVPEQGPKPTPVYSVAPTPAEAPIPTPAPVPVIVSAAKPAASIPTPPTQPSRQYWFTFKPDHVLWVPGIALFVAFLLTFFRWAGLYPADYPAYTQNAWQALTAGLSKDPVAEDYFKLENDLRNRLESNWWLLPYFPFLILAMILALAGPILKLSQWKLPASLEKIWSYRPALVGILSILLFFLLVIQWSSGFGINRAVVKDAQIKNNQEREEANTPEKIQRSEMKIANEWGKHHPETTIWVRFAVLAHLVAVIGAVIEGLFLVRGNRPPPKVGIEW